MGDISRMLVLGRKSPTPRCCIARSLQPIERKTMQAACHPGLDTRRVPGGARQPSAYDEYPDRGEGENRNKELQYGLQADRPSDHRYFASRFRLYLHTAAHNLLVRMRHQGAAPPQEADSEDLPTEALAASKASTSAPPLASLYAAVIPAGPPPMMATLILIGALPISVWSCPSDGVLTRRPGNDRRGGVLAEGEAGWPTGRAPTAQERAPG